MRLPVMFVKCEECGEDHYSDEVVTENIEEDIMGRDVLTFVCPNTGNTTKSLVYVRNQ
jgi:uncharacterized Zn finger protein